MGIQSFLKAQRGDPDWVFTPEQYFEKEFKIINASMIELAKGDSDHVVLRQNPTERELLAKHIRVDIRENAILDLTIINEASHKLQQVFLYDIRIREGGSVNMGLFVKGGKLNKHIIQVTLDNGATFNAYGHAINTVGGDSEIITKTDHQGEYSISNQFFTCEAGENSQTVFQGMINICETAKYSQINVDNSNLIVGKGGRCQGVPEIHNSCDTAKIENGASTEFLDPEKVYYLQTRGLSLAQSEEILINKHRSKCLEIISTDRTKEEIKQLFF